MPPFPRDVALQVVVSGATGLIGAAVVDSLRRGGHTVRRLVRTPREAQAGDISWNPERGHLDADALSGCNAIIHLAGAPIGQRWTPEHKREIRESRIRSTSLLAHTIRSMRVKPSVVLSGSAIGYYGDRGDELLDESSIGGADFLASVVQDWEDAAAPIVDAGVRLVTLRTGIVLSKRGGALEKMLLPFRMGAGGRMGDGRQWMSWIALSDHVHALEHLIRADEVDGPVNLVAPHPVTNEQFTSTLGGVLSRPTFVAVPAFALDLAFGEMAGATILASQRVAPRVLAESGFTFKYPTLEQALRNELAD